MKNNDSYLKKLKECLTIDELRDLMNGQPVSIFGSKFEDEDYLLPTSSGRSTQRANKVNNEILDLFLRTSCILKFNGAIGLVALGSGQQKYYSMLHSNCLELEKIQPDIKSMSNITESTIEDLSFLYLKRTYPPKSRNPITTFSTLNQLLNLAKYTNYILPPFMQLDPLLFLNSKSFIELKKLYHEEIRNKHIVGSSRTPYSLINLKKIVGEAIGYVESYSDDVFVATDIYVKGKKKSVKSDGKINSRKFHSLLCGLVQEANHTFTEPSLKSLQDKVIIGKRTPYLSPSISSSIHKLEASCTIIIFMTTGMRLSEFTRLHRYPELIDGDSYKLKRMVYKTAPTEHGLNHTIPIPEIAEKAIMVLSKLSEIIDGKKEGNLLLSSVAASILRSNDTIQRPGKLIHKFSRDLGIEKSPTPHNFRHAMAFLIAFSNKKDGLELARTFLKHQSITMTLQYMGHYNQTLREAVKELYMEESKEHAKTITNELKKDKRLYGVKAETILGDYQFTGSYAEDFIDIIDQSLMGLIDKGEIAIIQTPVCVCVHDLTSPEAMACQRGFDIKDFVEEFPKPSKCEGTICKNAVFLESQLDDMDFIPEDDELRKRLEKNKFFTDAGGFDNDPMEKILKQHREHQKRIVNG